MTQQAKRQRKNGFTMVELIVTLVIMGILFAIAVPNLTGYIHLSQFRKNESYAKTMYLSAESSLTYYRTGGEWEDFKRKVEKEGTLDKQYGTDDSRYGRIYGLRLDRGEYGADSLDGDAALVAELLENDTYDKSVLNASICIEIDISTGQVYSVFYGTACDGLYYESNTASKPATASGTWLDMDQRGYDTRRAERLGYYSVQDVANVVNLDMTKLKITSINLVNSETLSLNWSSNSKNLDKDVRYQLKFYNDADKSLLFSMEFKPLELNGAPQKSLTVKMADGTTADYTFPLEYDQTNKRFSLTLDAMMNANLQKMLEDTPTAKNVSSTSITRFGGALSKPLNIYATIQAFPNEDAGVLNPGDEYQSSNPTSSNTANTLFGNGTSGTKCEIETFRHLSNIRYMDDGAQHDFAVTARTLDWTSDSVKVYQAGDHGSLLAVSGNYASFPSVPKLTAKQTLDGNSGLVNRIISIVTGGNSISNLKLDKDSIASGSEYLGLFQRNEGTITNLKLETPQVRITSDTVKGTGAICGYSSGSLKSSQVTDAAVTADLSGNSSAQGIGGLVGVADMQKTALEMQNLSAAGQVTGTLPSSGIERGVGGIVGNMTIKNAQVSDLDNEAAVTGSRSAGGVFGCLSRPGQSIMTGQDVTDCTNEGLILSGENASTAAGNYAGHYIGGIVGYAHNVSLGNCVSHAVYNGDGNTFQYQQADREELLRGKYVGGIMGYSDSSALYKCSTRANGYVLGDSYVGGIVGGTNGRADKTFLSDPNKVYITTNASYVIGNSYVGGIIGINKGQSKIENCVNTGVVAGYNYYVGGICGANMAEGTERPTILNCASYVSDTHNKIYNLVTGWGATANFAGGLTGYNNGAIQFTKDAAVGTRSVAGIVVGKNYVGGVVGYNDADGTIDVEYKLIGGRVRATGDCAGGLAGVNASVGLLKNTLTIQPSSVQGRYYVGGAIGANVVNLTENVTMDGITVNNSLGTITAAAYCGGLIGYQRTYTASDLGGARLQDAINNGLMLSGIADGNVPRKVNVSTNPYVLTITAKDNSKLTAASNNMTIRAYAYAGGIVGYCESNSKMYVKDCLNKGGFERPDISSALSVGVDMETYLRSQGYAQAAQALHAELNGSEMRVSIIGGVVGVNGENHVIDHCSNTGTMNGLDAMGGVVGLNEGLITDCTLSGSMGSATQNYIGGIAGLNVGGKTQNTMTYGSGTNIVRYTAGTITNCETAKNVTVTGQNTVGGIVGYNIGYAASDTTIGGTVENNRSFANVSGTSRVGGIAGENGGILALSTAQTSSSRRVSGTGTGVGGVIGVNTATGALRPADDATGDVIAADKGLTVRGGSMVGGIVGINRGKLGGTAGRYLTNQAAEVRATNGNAGGVVGVQNGTAAQLRYAKNLGQVTANVGAAGGIVGRNNEGNTVENCIGNGNVTSNDGYAGGVVSENLGEIKNCAVGSDSTKVTLITRGTDAAGAVCAINHQGGMVSGAELGSQITISGSAFMLGAVVGDNAGTVTDTTVKAQPKYDISVNALQVGGAVGINRAGGIVSAVTVASDFDNFTKYQYLGGIVGVNCKAAVDETKQETDTSRTTAAGEVRNCTYSGTISEGKSAVGNCYGGIAGLNNGRLDSNKVSALTIKASGAYTATSTSSAADKERLSSHIGGIAGKNDTNGVISGCYIDTDGSNSITVKTGMVGGVTGFNKGTITMSGDKSTETLMKSSAEESGQVEKISELLANAKAANLKADDNWVKWQDGTDVEKLYYNGGGATSGGSMAVAAKRTMQIIVSSNGNLGGVTGYNAPTGELSRCVSGNWLLVNKSDSISVGTGGIVGMNESEKDLSYLLNRAFVGRQLQSARTNRFAGGIIGTQSNKTSNGWTINGCVNYGTIYSYHSHYSGGIIGQWTQNGGTIEDCYNYGNLQTTYQAGWVGASGGIVAQLYHASSGQDFNILSCQNHGNIYGHNGTGRNQCANDSAGILGNVTAYRADNGGGQEYTINVVNCVNGAGVNIYSASMASGIVGFFSTDGVAGNSRAEQAIGLATENIVLNIDRCRNYAQSLNANYQFRGGLFGDRYVSVQGQYNSAGTENTYIQNGFSVSSASDGSGSNDGQEIASKGNNLNYSVNSYLTHASNNYYFKQAWIMSQNQETNNRVVKTWPNYETRRAGAHMLVFGTLENKSKLVAARVGKVFSDSTDSNQNFDLFCDMNDYNTKIDANNDLKSQYDGSEITSGHVLFELPQTKDAYKRFAALYQNDQTGFCNAIRTGNGAMSDMDDYVQSYYREFEHGRNTLSGDAETENGKYQYKLDTSFTVKLDQAEDGSFDVAITDTDRPLYYEGEVLVDGKTVLSNLRFIPRENGQGVWKGTFDGTSTGYGSGTTTGTFQLPENLAASTAGRQITLKVRAVSLFEDTAPSDEVSASTDNVAVLPQPDVSIRLYSTENNNSAKYKVLLSNYNDFTAFTNWKVTLKLGSQTKVIDSSNPTAIIDGENIKELIVTATAAETNGIKPAAVTQTIPTDTPSYWYTPDGSIKSLAVTSSGNTVDDFAITASLTVNETTMDTPPIYRVEVLGTENGKEIVFAYDDVLTSAGNTVTANFTNLPVQYFANTVTNRRVRAWYAASGLGPVYTYGDTPVTTNDGEAMLTYRTYDANGTATDKTVYSFPMGQNWWFTSKPGKNYITTTNLNITPLAAPVLNAPEKRIEGGSLQYRFSWTQPREGTSIGHYTVKLTGITADGARIGIPTNEVYTSDTAKEFTINADDWRYTQVELTVTRKGQNNGEVGLSATQKYDVQQRLERPGQPSVTNEDTNELTYTISWSAISDQKGCGQYRIYVQPQNGTAVPLGDPVAADSSASRYSVKRNLEDYAGQTITIYLVAEADGSGQYANSPNGISYTMTVPTRINTPHISWATSWNGLSTVVSADQFANGGLYVTVTPDAASVPPGGSTYLLKATIIDAAGNEVEYPGKGDVLAMAENGSSYICNLTELETKYAGCRIRFAARISQSAGQVSSAWVESGEVTLPRVKLATPTVSLSNDKQTLTVKYGVSPELLLNSESWTAQLTTLSWQAVENADEYRVELIDKVNDKLVTTILHIDTTENPPKIEAERGNSRETLAVGADDWYTVKQGDAVTGNYVTTGGSTRYYQYTVDTLLRVNGDTYTLSLPNVFSFVTHEQQTLQLNNVQTTEVKITAQSTSKERYEDSAEAERNFN